MKKIAYVIPARMESSRFPGKPLATILGKEMIFHVIDRVASVIEKKDIYVATDSDQISSAVNGYGYQVLRTGRQPTGTDRVAVANRELQADYVINIQGDEPSFNPEDIVISTNFLLKSDFDVITGYCALQNREEWLDRNTIKLVFSNSSRLLYISRSLIPGSKSDSAPGTPFRQVCLYGYTRHALEFFLSTPRSPLELREDHELLRYIENDVSVGVVELSDWSVPVDTPSDLLIASLQLKEKFGISLT